LKQYTITIKGKVLEVGFRGYVRELCSREGVKSIVYNTEEGDLKLLCEASRETLEDLASRIKDYKFVEISDIRIEEGIELPQCQKQGQVFHDMVSGTPSLKTGRVRVERGHKILHIDDENPEHGEAAEDVQLQNPLIQTRWGEISSGRRWSFRHTWIPLIVMVFTDHRPLTENGRCG